MQDALIRLIVLAVLLLNQSLIVAGMNPLPFSGDDIFQGVSLGAMVVASLWSWWKNNSVTTEAKEADKYLQKLRSLKRD